MFLTDTMPVPCEDCMGPADKLSRWGRTSPVCNDCEDLRERELGEWLDSQKEVVS